MPKSEMGAATLAAAPRLIEAPLFRISQNAPFFRLFPKFPQEQMK
jgi:hypothetical protein